MSYLDGGADPTGEGRFNYYYDKIAKLLHEKAKVSYPSVFKFFDLDVDIDEPYFDDTISYCADWLFSNKNKTLETIEENCEALNLEPITKQIVYNLFNDVERDILCEIEEEENAERESEQDYELFQKFKRAVFNSNLSDEMKMFFVGC